MGVIGGNGFDFRTRGAKAFQRHLDTLSQAQQVRGVDLTEAEHALIRSAAALILASEQQAAKLACGTQAVDPSEVARLSRELRELLAQLGSMRGAEMPIARPRHDRPNVPELPSRASRCHLAIARRAKAPGFREFLRFVSVSNVTARRGVSPKTSLFHSKGAEKPSKRSKTKGFNHAKFHACRDQRSHCAD
jgi:hypothetical protein